MTVAFAPAATARRFGPVSLPPPPSPFEPDSEWQKWHARRRATVPGWYADRGYVNSYALEYLPRVRRALGLGDAVAILPRPRWWASATLPDFAAALHGTRLADGAPVLALRLLPDSYDLLFIDRATGEWDVPNLCRSGADLVSLAAWRLDVSDTKAAHRLARACGLRRPMP